MTVDPCLEAFLAEPRNTVRRPPPHVPFDKIRQVANAAMPGDGGPVLPSVIDLSARLSGRVIPLRLYRPSTDRALPLIVFAHGGGWVWGNLQTHDAICRRLALASGAAVLAVDYRLAPENGAADPIEDVFEAFAWARAQAGMLGLDGNRIALCGDSAGAALALAAAIRASEEGLAPRHLAMVYPALDPACASASQAALAEGYMLTRDAMRWFWECRLGQDSGATVPLANPVTIASERLRVLPPVTLAVAEFDILRDEGIAFAQRLRAAGIPVRLRSYAGMIHGFLSVAPAAAFAERAIGEIAADLALSLGNQTAEPVRP